jgi:hypothetical protein
MFAITLTTAFSAITSATFRIVFLAMQAVRRDSRYSTTCTLTVPKTYCLPRLVLETCEKAQTKTLTQHQDNIATRTLTPPARFSPGIVIATRLYRKVSEYVPSEITKGWHRTPYQVSEMIPGSHWDRPMRRAVARPTRLQKHSMESVR